MENKLSNIKFNMTKVVTEVEEVTVQSILDKHGVDPEKHIIMPFVRNSKGEIELKDGKKILKKRGNGQSEKFSYVGSVQIIIGAVLIELGLGYSPEIQKGSERKAPFKAIVPFNVIKNENGSDDFRQISPYGKDLRNEFTGVGNTRSFDLKDGTQRQGVSSYIRNDLLKAIKIYIDTICADCTYVEETKAQTSDANTSETEDSAEL
jgi:hypothetical protein